MTKNKDATRYFSGKMEDKVANIVCGQKTINSGASKFSCGDVINKDASILLECKCSMTNKDSFSIKKEWIEKINSERLEKRLSNYSVAIDFGPDSDIYFLINSKLMSFLIEKLEEDEKLS